MSWLILFSCLVLSFLVSGTEAGILSLNRLRVQHLARQKDRAAIRFQRLLKQPARLLVTVLVVTDFLNIIALVLLTNTLVSWCGWPGYFFTLFLALPLFLIGVEILPKSIFRGVSYRTLASLTVLLDGISALLSPLIYLSSLFSRCVLHREQLREIFVAREYLKYVTTEIERMGMLSSIERQMIHNVVDFRTVKVADVMIRCSDAIVVHLETPIEELLTLCRRHGFDHYPVVDTSGKIIGVVNVFDLVVNQSAKVSDLLRRILTVCPEEEASVVLWRLCASPQDLAVVVDESGQTIGIVGTEDLLNPLVQVAQ
jgi:CBS domain containing-hemolysin-like protein